MSDTTTVTEEPVDNFQAAFDQLAALGDKPVTLEAMAGVAPAVEPPATDPPAADPPATDPPATDPPATDPPATDPPAAEPPAATEPPKPSPNEDMLNRLAELVRDKSATPATTPTTPEPPPELYTAEEKALLAKYVEDWPDVVRAEALMRRAEYRDLSGFIFQEVAKVVGPALQLVESMANRTHLADIQTSVPDYRDVRDKVVDWVAKQPAYLRTAYEHVVSQGTAEEVADLISRYRAETGETTKAPPAASVPEKKDTELPPVTKKVAAALAPVSSKRTAVLQGSDPGDFDAAFAEAAKV